jgi:hypothetical protein
MGLGDRTDPLDDALEVGRTDDPPILIDMVDRLLGTVGRRDAERIRCRFWLVHHFC